MEINTNLRDLAWLQALGSFRGWWETRAWLLLWDVCSSLDQGHTLLWRSQKLPFHFKVCKKSNFLRLRGLTGAWEHCCLPFSHSHICQTLHPRA